MGVWAKLRQWWRGRQPVGPLAEWYFVRFDEEGIHVRVEPPWREAWSDTRRWDEIVRIGFEATDVLESDAMHLVSRGEERVRSIPTEASGGEELWTEILRRELFDAELAIQAAGADQGLYFWPPLEDQDEP